MRQQFIILTVFIVLAACTNTVSAKVLSDTLSVKQISSTTKTTSQRQILIDEIKKVRGAVASNDKAQITGIFDFPLSGKDFDIFIHDSTYNEFFKSEGDKTTKVMFLKYFNEIKEVIGIDEVNNLFRQINVDSLLYKDTLVYDAIFITEPCYYSYKIEIYKNKVTL